MTYEETTAADLGAKLDKLKRRQARNERAAFARGLLQGVRSMLRPGDVVIDCGANIGDVAEPLADTGATVLAYEPDPYAFGRLEARLGQRSNVKLHNAAVGVEAGTVRLMRASNFDDNPKGGSVKSTIVSGGRNIDERVERAVEVGVIDLPALIRDICSSQGEIAFLKMDIEGAELELLERMMRHKLFDTIRLTVAETHERKFRSLRPRFAELRKNVSANYPITKVNLDWI